MAATGAGTTEKGAVRGRAEERQGVRETRGREWDRGGEVKGSKGTKRGGGGAWLYGRRAWGGGEREARREGSGARREGKDSKRKWGGRGGGGARRVAGERGNREERR